MPERWWSKAARNLDVPVSGGSVEEYYDRQGRPISERKWRSLYAKRRVALTRVGGQLVSTIYLGRPVNLTGDVPLIFETTASLGCDSDDTVHTSTEAKALVVHKELVQRLREQR